jgi:hypothetical protein
MEIKERINLGRNKYRTDKWKEWYKILEKEGGIQGTKGTK